MGVQEVVSSRDTRFVSGGAAWAGRVGIVLNSLTSAGMVAATVAGLQEGGRMVEIGKRDIWSPALVRSERRDVLYNLVAVDFLPPPCACSLLKRVSELLAGGVVAPLPGIGHGLGSVAAAMRAMSQAKHIGKVVASAYLNRTLTQGTAKPALVTGGLGFLGTAVSAWLLQAQVTRMQLAGRSG